MSVRHPGRTLSLFLLTAFCGQGSLAAAWIEPNVGQTDEEYNFVVRAEGLTALVANRHIDFRIPGKSPQDTSLIKQMGDDSRKLGLPERHSSLALRLQLVNASVNAIPAPGNALQAVSHYFTGKDETQWHTNVPHIADARIADVYPGIDVVYRLNDNRLEYDFEVSPGADLRNIQLQVHGVEHVSINENGEWLAKTPFGDLRQLAPVVFQTIGGRRNIIAGSFVQQDNGSIGFELGEHQKNHTLVIDPVIEFSGYVGGSTNDQGKKLLETSTGNYILLGSTTSIDFTGTTPNQLQGDLDVFVMELDPATGTPNWVTILGGSDEDNADNMQIDSAGNIVLIGFSASADYPTLNAFQPNFVGSEDPLSPNFNWDAIITKLSGDGSSIVFSTFMGGVDADFSVSGKLGFELFRGIDLDSSDNIYVAGQTAAADFPVTTTVAGQTCMQADANSIASFVSDIIFAKFSPDGTRLASACIGGTERDAGRDITLGPDGSIYLAGFGRSPDLPGTTGFFQPQPIEELFYSPFVIKLTPDMTTIDFATYVGEGILQEIVVDTAGDVYGAGTAFSNLFPVTAGAFQTEFQGDPEDIPDAFAFKLNASGTDLFYATYLGGLENDEATSIVVDDSGRLYVAGVSDSPGYPLKNPIDDNVGAILGGTQPFAAVTAINNIRRGFRFDSNGFSGNFTYIARNGINQVGVSEFSQDFGTVTNVGTAVSNSSDMLPYDFNSDGVSDELFVTSTDAANEFYLWNANSQEYELLGTTGTVTSDSRGATIVQGANNVSYAVVANHGESNQFVGLNTVNPYDPVSFDFGRVDGNTTAVAAGYLGIEAIVFANENQDIRLHPRLGDGSYGDAVIISNNPGAVSAIDIGDVNGDGTNDLVVAKLDGPVEVILFEAGSPVGSFPIPETVSGNTDVILVDVDQDGDNDLLVTRNTNDLFFENTGNGALVNQGSFTGYPGISRALATLDDDRFVSTVYIATDAGIDETKSGRPSLTLSVLNPSGSDLEFSTFLRGDGSSGIFRGLEFARGSDSKVLIAANTAGQNWPKVNSSTEFAGGIADAVYMVLELDQDQDDVLDGIDNCLLVSNPDQRDTDADGFGSLCDPDLNNDDIVNFLDISIFAGVFQTDNENADFDGDGAVTFLDLVILRDYFLQPPGPGTGPAL